MRNCAQMTPATSADLTAEAKRILAMSISKLYASRSQRGGLRLHRSLLLSMVMRTTRDIYHSACLLACPEDQERSSAAGEPMETTATAGEQAETCPATPAPISAETAQTTTEETETVEDKENEVPADMNPVRHSRKRPGRASVAPDFLPSKRARLEPGEERHTAAQGGVVASLGNCRTGESLTTLSLNQIIPAF